MGKEEVVLEDDFGQWCLKMNYFFNKTFFPAVNKLELLKNIAKGDAWNILKRQIFPDKCVTAVYMLTYHLIYVHLNLIYQMFLCLMFDYISLLIFDHCSHKWVKFETLNSRLQPCNFLEGGVIILFYNQQNHCGYINCIPSILLCESHKQMPHTRSRNCFPLQLSTG